MLTMLRENPAIIRADEIETPEEFAGRVRTYSIRYQSDACEVEGYVSAPRDGEGPYEAIIYNRGGNREFGCLTPEAVCRFASHGYVVLGSQYRGNCGGTGKEEFGGSDIRDVIHLTDLALALPCVRKEGVYMAGRSRGGMMTYKACALDDRIKAAAVLAGLADSVMMYELREDSMKQVYHELVGGSPAECPEAFRERSAVCWADQIIPPILICQGTNDWRVAPEQAYKMKAALDAAGKEAKLIVYEGADHSLKDTSAVDEVVKWFEQHPL